MEPYKVISWEIRKHNLNSLWGLADRWFRVLEFSFILGILTYFKDKVDTPSLGMTLELIHWVSWGFLYMLVLELIDTFAQLLSKDKSTGKKWLVWFLSFIIIYFIYIMIIGAVGSIQLQLIEKPV